MLAEFVESLKKLVVTARPPVIEMGDGSGRRLLYDDLSNKYEPVDRFIKRERSVSNVESFAAMVVEEARRAGIGDDADAAARDQGSWMTVIFTKAGAQLHLDDRDGRTVFSYNRARSPLLERLLTACRGDMGHRAFVRALQSLQTIIVDGAKVVGDYRRVNVEAGVAVDSAEMEQGDGGFVYRLSMKIRGKTADAELPTFFVVNTPVVRGSSTPYALHVDVNVELDQDSDPKKVVFSLDIPECDAVFEKAVSDEVTWFRSRVKHLPLLSILEDY